MAVAYAEDQNGAYWKAHDHAVDQCRGQVCLYAIADSFGLSPELVDVDAVEVKCQLRPGEIEDDLEANGTIRRWCTNGNKPRRDSIEKIKRATSGEVDLEIWLKNPLLVLLRQQPPSIHQLNQYLEQAPPRIRKILLLEPDKEGSFSHHNPERRTVLALRNTWCFDGFIAMLCLARRGEVLGMAPAHALPAMCAYDMFPRVALKSPLIRLQWRRVADCLHRVFWRRIYRGGISLQLPLEVLIQRVERLALHPRSRYKLQSGRLLSVEDELSWKIKWLGDEMKRLRAEAERKKSHKLQMDKLTAMIDDLELKGGD